MAIIISKQFGEGWRKTGNTTRLREIAVENTMRLMGLDVVQQENNSKKRKVD